MTLREWYLFNKDVLAAKKCTIVIFEKPSLKSDDIELEANASFETAIKLFGNYILRQVQYNAQTCMFRMLLWPVNPNCLTREAK